MTTMPERDPKLVSLWLVLVVSVGGLAVDPVLTAAYFHDVDSAANNTVSGGVVDPKLSEAGPATQNSTTDESGTDAVRDTWEDLMHPTDGSQNVNNTVELSTTDSMLDVSSVNVTVSYAENDSGGTGGNGDSTASTVEVVSLVYNGSELVGSELTDQNGNGIVDVEDLTNGSNADALSSLNGIPAGGNRSLHVSLSGKATLLDGVTMGDGLDVTVTFRAERSSYVDEDRSSNNTVLYE